MTRPEPEARKTVETLGTPKRRGVVYRAVMLVAMAPVVVVLGQGAPQLFEDVTGLQGEWDREEDGRAVGYASISPKLNFARPPENWFDSSKASPKLWGGWDDGVGHHWFDLGAEGLDRERLSTPISRDVFRAIDVPIVEHDGDERWELVPGRAEVFAFAEASVSSAYPTTVIRRVWVVNDTIDGRPVMVACRDVSPTDYVVEAFLPVIDGEGRVTFGASGYHYKGRPLLYDRATESLWVVGDRGLDCVAGKHRGVVLPRLREPERTSFGEWSSQHPGGRLIVGADRSAGRAKR